MKKLIMFCMVIALAVPIFSGIASAELVCFTICPSNAVAGDEVTMTGYDEEGEFYDLSTMIVFESNFHGIPPSPSQDPSNTYYTLLKDGDNLTNIEIIDGTVVFELNEDMLSGDVERWDFFGVPEEGDNPEFRIANSEDPEDAPFETVAEAIGAGGTCGEEIPGCAGDDPIAIDPNVMLVYEAGATVGDFDVSLRNPLPAGKTATVTVDPNSNGDGPSDDITLIGGSVVDGSITLTFTDSNWDVPQKVAYKAIDDLIAEPPELEEAQEILVTSVYSDTLQDPNWAGEKIVTVNVMDNDQANILFTYSSLFSSGDPDPEITYFEGDSIQMVEQPQYSFGTGYVLKRNIGVTLQVKPSGGDVRIVVFNEGESGNQPKMDPPLTEASEPNALIFTAANWDESQNIKIWGNDDDERQIEEAFAEGDQNYQAEIAFIVADGGGDERYQWEIETDEGTETEGLTRVVDIDIEDNECGAFGISYLDVGNPNAATDPNYQDDDGNPLPDCYVDIYDVIEFATKWLNCSDPQTEGCESYL
jgi:hypothetical protein